MRQHTRDKKIMKFIELFISKCQMENRKSLLGFIFFIFILLCYCFFIIKNCITSFSNVYLMTLFVLFFLTFNRFKLNNMVLFYLFVFPFNYWISMKFVNWNLSELLIITMFGLWIWSSLISGKIRYKTNPFNKWIVGYLLISFVLVLNSPMNNKSIYKSIIRVVECGVFFFVLVNNFTFNKKNLKIVSNLLIIAMLPVCFIGVVEFLIYSKSFPFSFIDFHQKMSFLGVYAPRPLKGVINLSLEGKAIGSTFGSKSALSIYLSAVLPLVFIKMLYDKGAFQKAIFVFVFGLGLINLFLTGSRTGLISLLFGLGIIFYIRKNKINVSAITGAILCFLLFFLFLPQNIQKRLLFRSHESSLIGRKVYAKRSMKIIKSNFFTGAGVDSLGSGKGQSKPHNAFLSEFQTKGIFGFLMIAGLFLTAIKYGYKNLKLLVKDEELGIYALWSFVVIMVYFVTSFAAEPFYENQTSILFFLGIAIISFLNGSLDYEKK